MKISRSCARAAGLALVLVVAAPVDAQEDVRRGFIGLGIGPSQPIGAFGKASPTDPLRGDALLGYTSTLMNLGIRTRERLGLAVTFSYSEYDMRDDGNNDWWQVAGIALGPMYTVPLSARISLDLKAMLGWMVLTPIVDSYTTAEGVGTGFGADVRAALRYDLWRRWAVFAEGGVHAVNVSYGGGIGTNYRALISGLGVAYRPAWASR